MSSSVKKIFIVLITIVALVIIGALVLNFLLPNAAKSLVNAIEDMIFKATKLKFDFNGDKNVGSTDTDYSAEGTAVTGTAKDGAGVDGFK